MPKVHIPPDWRLDERHATPESLYWNRRQAIAALGLAAAGLTVGGCYPDDSPERVLRPALGDRFADRFPAARNAAFTLGDDRAATPEIIAAKMNNFYEFTTDKGAVWELAQRYADGGLPPWRVEVGGLVEKPFTLDLDDLFAFPLEERLYRFRCVERWAMQVPWTGFPLAALIDRCKPLGKATHVRFVSFLDEERLPGQTEYGHYPWPYFEGLRLDEARHPLAFVVLGVYGHPLPMQHGAPWRLAIPWKYGYKGPKAVVRIELTEGRPETFWHQAQPREYGFFSNVDPGRPHPRWTQQTETDIGTGVMRPTLLYNGYASVAEMYEGWEH
ncbi:MAG TPA: protein-methionine-sulfoxide reductase catalytic subunit MsrP [Thermoanaerobaculia bacterium]|nr:protein-methionine-sulfoxide reductase catalytic subunit MsrP [Thermoanaerobaculia bacterium]